MSEQNKLMTIDEYWVMCEEMAKDLNKAVEDHQNTCRIKVEGTKGYGRLKVGHKIQIGEDRAVFEVIEVDNNPTSGER